MVARTCSPGYRSTGCGGRPSAACSSGWAASSPRGRPRTREYGVTPLRVLRVEDVMDPPLAPPTAAMAPVVTYPDELLETAMRKLLEHEVDVLPVASPDEPTRVVGYVERSAILGAWVQLTRDEHIREEGWLARLRRASR